VMSTSIRLRTSSGWCAANCIAVMPPSDMPTTNAACGASAWMAMATSSARLRGV
jgi:hypothetical protein